MSIDESEKNLDFVRNLQFADLYKSFKLIDNANYDRKDIFIEFDEDAKTVWEKFKNLNQNRDPFKRKTEFLKFRKDFYDYVISVPSKYVNVGEQHESGIIHIPYDGIEFCYDEKTGWQRKNEGQGCYVF